jgi:hypothetical protein
MIYRTSRENLKNLVGILKNLVGKSQEPRGKISRTSLENLKNLVGKSQEPRGKNVFKSMATMDRSKLYPNFKEIAVYSD